MDRLHKRCMTVSPVPGRVLIGTAGVATGMRRIDCAVRGVGPILKPVVG